MLFTLLLPARYSPSDLRMERTAQWFKNGAHCSVIFERQCTVGSERRSLLVSLPVSLWRILYKFNTTFEPIKGKTWGVKHTKIFMKSTSWELRLDWFASRRCYQLPVIWATGLVNVKYKQTLLQVAILVEFRFPHNFELLLMTKSKGCRIMPLDLRLTPKPLWHWLWSIFTYTHQLSSLIICFDKMMWLEWHLLTVTVVSRVTLIVPTE